MWYKEFCIICNCKIKEGEEYAEVHRYDGNGDRIEKICKECRHE